MPFSNGGDILKIVRCILKMHCQYLKPLLSRTTKPISATIGTKNLWFKGIKFIKIKGHNFAEQLGQFQPNLVQSVLGQRYLKFVQIKQRGDGTKLFSNEKYYAKLNETRN